MPNPTSNCLPIFNAWSNITLVPNTKEIQSPVRWYFGPDGYEQLTEDLCMAKSGKSVTLIVSADKQPKVTVRPGMRLEVMTVKLADAQLKRPKKLGARLCSGGGTCIALVDIDPEIKA